MTAALEQALNPLQRLIQQRLRDRGWSYREAARRGGLPHSTVYTLATTRNLARPPRPATIDALARGLDVPVSAVRAAAAESTGLHYYGEAPAGRAAPGDPERELLIASIDELTPEDRRHVAALVRRTGKLVEQTGEHWARWGAARDGARTVLTRVQAGAIALLAVPGAVLVGTMPRIGLIVCIAVLTSLYLATGAYKISLLIRGELSGAKSAPWPLVPGPDELPIYTVLVPLFREGRMLPSLVERLERLDYPPEYLQVLLLVEPDDDETRSAADGYSFPPHIRPMLMPEGQPRTKPRALNIGLHEARGAYIVVYDAEDQPEPDQLRKAVAAMRALPPDIVCLQARLNFYNRHQSVLTRLSAADYTLWYNQFLPGLTSGMTRPGSFVPLGGTSNHFRVEVLREVGGWDPFNVTEDCDLGARLGREKLKVAMLDSTTWEEAVPRARPWIRQRSRWIKGYVQTYLVHMRRPLLLRKELGARGFADFQMLVGGSSFLLLINPLMWGLTAVYAGSKGTGAGNFIQSLFPAPLYYPALLSFVVWNFILFYCNVYVSVRHNLIDLTRYTLLTPVYWVLMSVAAWTGLISLIRNPSYWAKTEHGVSLPSAAATAALPVRVPG